MLKSFRRHTAKKRKLRFEVTLTLRELTNVATHSAAAVWVRVKCPGCATVESRRQKVEEQAVAWGDEGESFPMVANMAVDDASNVVDSFIIRLSVRAATATARRCGRPGTSWPRSGGETTRW